MKKILMIFLSIALIFTMAAPTLAANTVNEKFTELKAAGILDGAGSTGSMPSVSSTLTREHLAKISVNLAGLEPAPGVSINAFAGDYKTGVWGFEQGWIQAAYLAGLMKGKGAAGFDARSNVTIAELLTVVLRAAGYGEELDNNNWASSAVAVALEKGFISQTVNSANIATYGDLVNQTYNAHVIINDDGSFKILSANAVNSETIAVQLNQNLELKGTDFNIVQKDNQNVQIFVQDVSVQNKVAELTLMSKLTDKKTYRVTAIGTSEVLEFTYNAAKAASIEIISTKIAIGDTVEYIVYDAQGNDITIDAGALTRNSSNTGVITTTLQAIGTGVSVVNLSIGTGTNKVESGNTTITVVASIPLKLTSLGEWTLSKSGPDYKKPKHSMSTGDTGVDALTIYVQALDQKGNNININETTISYRSLTPTIAVVDASSGIITPVQTGNARIAVTVEHGTSPNKVTLMKTVTFSINPAPVATAINLTTNNSDLVEGSGIYKPVAVTVVDQYGEIIDIQAGSLHVKSSKDDIVDNVDKTGRFVVIDDGQGAIELEPGELSGTLISDTAVLTFTYNGVAPVITKTLNVKLVKEGTLAGYEAVADYTTLDHWQDDPFADDKYSQGPGEATVKVYKVDNRGNYIGELNAGPGNEGFMLSIPTTGSKGVQLHDIALNKFIVDPAGTIGTGKVDVIVGEGVKIGTLTIRVVNSEPVLTTVNQVKSAIAVSWYNNQVQVRNALFGVDKSAPVEEVAFVAYNQYGDRVAISLEDFIAASADTSIITHDLDPQHTVVDKIVTVTLKIGKQYFTINIKVSVD